LVDELDYASCPVPGSPRGGRVHEPRRRILKDFYRFRNVAVSWVSSNGIIATTCDLYNYAGTHSVLYLVLFYSIQYRPEETRTKANTQEKRRRKARRTSCHIDRSICVRRCPWMEYSLQSTLSTWSVEDIS
jgi:hypothetical protein